MTTTTTTTTTSAAPAMAHGPVLGRYHLAQPIAAGGAATVYLARAAFAPGVTRAVAVKCLHPHLARHADEVAMFVDEARLACRIAHPNVCSVLDVGQVDGTWLIAMEHLAGVSLATLAAAAAQRPDVTRSRAWPVLVAQMVAEACEGLHAAHELRDERGQLLDVVHRDATTHNVVVTWDGAVKLVDFGIALARGRVPRTQAGMLRGKVAYVSPEQMLGHTLDRRSDVWSMAVGLWELLTLERLFARRSDAETFEAIRTQPIAAPSTRMPLVPPALDAIVGAALQRDPARRIASAGALATALRGFVALSGVAATREDLAALLDALLPGQRARAVADHARALAALPRAIEPTAILRTAPRQPKTSPWASALDAIAGSMHALFPAQDDAPVAPAEAIARGVAWALAAVLVVLALSLGARGLVRRTSMRAVALDTAPAALVAPGGRVTSAPPYR